MKFVRSMAALMALACCIPVPVAAQQSAPIYFSGATPQASLGTFPVASLPTAVTLTSGTAVTLPLSAFSSPKFQIAGLNADSLLIQQSLDCTNYVTATVLKNDLTTTAASALTGTSANGIYSVMVFGGCLKITRTGSADTLTFTYRGTN